MRCVGSKIRNPDDSETRESTSARILPPSLVLPNLQGEAYQVHEAPRHVTAWRFKAIAR